MHGQTSRILNALAAALVAGWAASAGASPGNGIRIGGSEGRLHPFLDLETRYDSNVAYTATDTAVADIILHVRPGMELELPGDLAAVEFSGALDWAQYLGVEEDTTNLSRFYGDARIAALFARRSPLSLRVDNEFRRQVSSSSLTAATTAVVSNSNSFAVSVPFRPGGGALVLAAKGEWLLETFEEYRDDPAGPELGDLGYNQFRGGAEIQWRFLPRTTAVLQAGYYTRVPNGARSAEETSGVEVMTGVTGLLTDRISATVKGGYGSTAAPARDSQAALADVGVEWLLVDSLSFRAGYGRSLGIDPSASTYVSDAVSAGARMKLGRRFALRAGARYDRLAFDASPGADTAFLRVDPEIEGAIGRWLSVGMGYVYSARVSSWPAGAPPDYAKDEAFFRVGVTY